MREHGDLSMDECYFGKENHKGNDKGKDKETYEGKYTRNETCKVARDVQADYFCGREGHRCHDDDEVGRELKARLAMRNMEAYYTVGVNERFEDTLRMFEGTYPAFFRGLVDKYGTYNSANNNNANKGEVSDRLVERLLEENRVDAMLWRAAGDALGDWERRCA